METIQLEKKNLIAAYNNGTSEEKKLLETLYGKQHFGSVIDRVKTVKDACQELDVEYVSIYNDCNDDYERAEKDIKLFAMALREGKPASECWYYPYFERSSGGGFSFYGYDYGGGCSRVGARLRVDTYEKATHMGKCLLNQYKTYING